MKLILFNSLTKKKQIFTPLNIDLIKMYVCGPTVYDHPHIGNTRSVIVYDILYRILIKIYGKNQIKYVRNITDIDDKIIARAKKENISISELTKKTIECFHKDMKFLGCLRPTFEPKATDHVKEVINIIQKLLQFGIAYQINGHVYFDITKSKNYGALSGHSLDEILKNVRIENRKDKKNAGDFVLWKPSNPEDNESVKFKSPFGVGRPGWHIECSAMSHKFLGETFDIHGGGVDLIFPHHTNEIAQSCSAFPGSKFAKIWVHNGFLTVNHKKMSKSLGNFITIQDLRKEGIDAEVIRLFLISNHYRKPIDYNNKAISDAKGMISYWYRAIDTISMDSLHNNLPKPFVKVLFEDINTRNAIKIINDYAKQAHSLTNHKKKKDVVANLLACANFLGVMNYSAKEWFQYEIDSELIESLISQRFEAKRAKNWSKADNIRDKLISMNIDIEDKSDGSTIWRKRNS